MYIYIHTPKKKKKNVGHFTINIKKKDKKKCAYERGAVDERAVELCCDTEVCQAPSASVFVPLQVIFFKKK
jgi:hypothetical protein